MQTAALIPFIIAVGLLAFAYDYLRKLESCLCAQGMGSDQNHADIQKLKYIQIFLIVLAFLNFFLAFTQKLNKLLSTIFFFLMLAIYAFFIIHVRRLYNNISAQCECAIQWPRYILYLQAILYTFVLILFMLSIVMFYYGIISKSKK